jgi:hypothetical protein
MMRFARLTAIFYAAGNILPGLAMLLAGIAV